VIEVRPCVLLQRLGFPAPYVISAPPVSFVASAARPRRGRANNGANRLVREMKAGRGYACWNVADLMVIQEKSWLSAGDAARELVSSTRPEAGEIELRQPPHHTCGATLNPDAQRKLG